MPQGRFGWASFVAGLALFAYLLMCPPQMPVGASRTLAMLALMAWWWLTEAVPVHVTALTPLVALPVLQPLEGGWAANLLKAARPFADGNIFLFLGGMCIAAAMERHGLHRRLALGVLVRLGTRRVLLGFLLVTAFISLWISNTATAVMVVPIAVAVLGELELREGRKLPALAQAVMLAVAYGANIGGIGTKIGTAPNMQLAGFLRQRYALDLGFLDYLMIGLPFVLLFLPIAYAMLQLLVSSEAPPQASGEVLDREYAALGPARREEKQVAAWFVTACSLWIFSKPIGDATGLGAELDPWISVAVALALFATRLIGAKDLKNLQWDALLLLGGSFALAAAVKGSGLADHGARQLAGVAELTPFVLMLTVTFGTVFLSAFTSNTSTTQVMLEVVASALAVRFPRPVSYLCGVSISASCDFMLPAGTPPNAIVFGTGRIRLPPMALAGFFLDVAAALLAAAWCYVAIRI